MTDGRTSCFHRLPNTWRDLYRDSEDMVLLRGINQEHYSAVFSSKMCTVSTARIYGSRESLEKWLATFFAGQGIPLLLWN